MKNETWSTKDFYSAALVRASGIPLVNLVKREGSYVTFVFDASYEICDDIIRRHWDRSLKLETRLLIETINELKTRIHEAERV